ncbi:MAG: ABC transporter ATP-binding protein [Alphaproteobacteria bacterium]|nr:ABC transporter ATP-binding protein [Alphaproteobacteria bacterium]
MDLDLECRDLAKRYGAFTAVDGVSFSIPRGSFFSILGPSGCGKTTLLRMIAGFVEPTSGDILIRGRSVLATPPNRRPVNLVFQHLALFPMMSVAENIAYGLRRRGAAKAEIERRVRDILARIGLPDAGAKRIDQLSGGQKQRIAIARCMVLEPSVLLLDEPLGALDLKLREHMKVELKQLQHQFATTFVYITHDQSEALVMSDRVAVMNAGRFEQVGTPQELYRRPLSAFVAGFVGDSNRWRGRVVASGQGSVPGGVTVETQQGDAMHGVASDAGGPPGADGAVDIFVRPEAIALLPAGTAIAAAAPGANVRAATVETLLFNGASSRALFRTQRGEPVIVALPQTGQFNDLKPGDALALAWPADACRCFPAQPSAAGSADAEG